MLESAQPIAVRVGDGRYSALSLALHAVGGRFEAASPAVAVSIPRRLREGIGLPSLGISLVPRSRSGARAGVPNGTLTGASVLYANTDTDADTLVKPTPLGFDATTLLRSANSPQAISFELTLPPGASLRSNGSRSAVQISSGGRDIAAVLPPLAVDAAGVAVPTSLRASGRTVTVRISHRSASYTYPIAVDPEIVDGQLQTQAGRRSNWEFIPSNGHFMGEATVDGLVTHGGQVTTPSEFAFWGYQTKGNSHIWQFSSESEAHNLGAGLESILELEAPPPKAGEPGIDENKVLLSAESNGTAEYARKADPVLCPAAGCAPTWGAAENAVHFQQSATGKGLGASFTDVLYQGVVALAEPAGTHSATSYNTTSPEIQFQVESEGGKKETVHRVNALAGSGAWMSKYQGAIEVIAKDPGIGVAATKLEYEDEGRWEALPEHNYLEKEALCKGVQCFPEHREAWTLNSRLQNGEDRIRYRAHEAMPGTETPESEATSYATIKVDHSPPHDVRLTGLPPIGEIREAPYSVTAEATDGEGADVAASGIKSIAVYVDGRQVGSSGGACSAPKGECSGSIAVTVNGAELGAGTATIIVVAIDNAGNEHREGYLVNVLHSKPVPLGPGSLNLESGTFSLGSPDVAAGDGLRVGRTYSSRNLTAGLSGPLGPQWSLSLGNTESLEVLPEGNVELTAANGSQSLFVVLPEGKGYESPLGDSNLQLTASENEAKTEKTAYYLSDVANHTTVKFSNVTGGTLWLPTVQEGQVATEAVTYKYRPAVNPIEVSLPSAPAGVAAGPDGNTWFSEASSSKVGKVTPAGVVTEYPLTGGSGPGGITSGPDGRLWVAETLASKIAAVTTAGVKQEFSAGQNSPLPVAIVSGPNSELYFTDSKTGEIGIMTISGTLRTKKALGGSEIGLSGIALGPDGNLWFTAKNASRIGKMTPAGTFSPEVSLPAGSAPTSIASGSDGNLWFTDTGTNKIGKITTAGTVTEYALPSGSAPVGITSGPGGNLWFTNSGTSKLARITTAGAISEYELPTGSEPRGISKTPGEGLAYANNATSKISLVAPNAITAEPTEALAPVPQGVSCSPTPAAGCRSLKFTYANATSAKGNAESEWGTFSGRLATVSLEAFDPASKTMKNTPVAEYRYDGLGRLRSEWDPRTESATDCSGTCAALKTTYGYDEAGHVTSLTPPGEQPSLFTYGTAVKDAGAGRLVKVLRGQPAPGASEEEVANTLKEERAVVASTEAPQVTGSPLVGARLAVSNGKWSGRPMTYGYQWEDCSSTGTQCETITGATNANYTLQASDAGHTVVAQVTAIAATNAAAASSNATALVGQPATEYAIPQLTGGAHEIKQGPDGNFWYLATPGGSSGKGKIDRITPEGKITEYAVVPAETWPEHLISGPEGAMWFTFRQLSNGTEIGGSAAKITPSGQITEYALPSTGGSVGGLTAGPEGQLWIVKTHRLLRMATNGTVTGEWPLSESSTTHEVTTGPDANLWFTSHAVGCCSERGAVNRSTTGGSLSEWLLPSNSNPTSIAPGPDGNLWFDETYSNTGSTHAIGKITPAGAITEYFLSASSFPNTIATGPDGRMWFVTGNLEGGTNALGAITTAGQVSTYPLPRPPKEEGFTGGVAPGFGDGDMWYSSNNYIGRLPINGVSTPTQGEIRPAQPGTAIEYGVALSGSGLPQMTSSEVARWGQRDDPTEGTAVIAPDSPQGWPASSYQRATLYYLDEQGRLVNVSTPSNDAHGAVSTTEYNELNDPIRTLSQANRITALEAGAKSAETAALLDTELVYNGERPREGEVEEPGTQLVERLGPQHAIKYKAGNETKESLGREFTEYVYDQGAPSETTHERYNLVTEQATLAALANRERVEVRTVRTAYSGQSNLGWKLRRPTSITTDPAGGDPEGQTTTSSTLYNESGQVIETRGAAGQAGNSAHDERIIYYSAQANGEGFSACGNHPEWSGLVCETLPSKQPETTGSPKVAEALTTYNMWGEPEKIEETFGGTKRTKHNSYDAAGRLESGESTVVGGKDKALPAVTNGYNANTGDLTKQSAGTQIVQSVYNTLGQRVSYSDADGNTARFRYGGEANDDLLEEITDSSNASKTKQTYAYDPTTKQLTTLTDSAAGTFTAAYDGAGRLASELYPNGMCANYAYNGVGEATHLEYIKTTNCKESGPPVWFSETRAPAVRGETITTTSTLATENYKYDGLGRLTEAQEQPTGEGCSVRLYSYDEESNRSSQTTRKPGTGGVCAKTGGTVLNHTYDEAGHLLDTGVAYEELGNATKLPAADAEKAAITSTYYTDGAVATQLQSGIINTYSLDPEGRVRETKSEEKLTKVVKAQFVSHYDAPGSGVAWTAEGESWTRNIGGVDGTLCAVQKNGQAPILQLHDLQGSIVATAADDSEATKLLSTYNSTEFGVPSGGKAPPTYAWLGASGVSSERPTGIVTDGSTSYIPQTGLALQSEHVEPPGLPYGSGGGAAYVSQLAEWNILGAERAAAEAPGLEAGREREAAEEAMRRAEAAGLDPEGIYTPESARHLADVINDIEQKDSALLDPYEQGRGAFGLEIYLGNIEYQEAFKSELRRCANIVEGFVKHGWKHIGACYVKYTKVVQHEVFDVQGTFTWIFKTHVQQCTYVRTGRYNEIYKCPQTPKYYYYLPRFPSAGPA